jgi:acetyl esterase/lipase
MQIRLLTREALEISAELYLGEHDRRNPSPLYGDLSGLPPVLLHVGEDEISLDDSCASLKASAP